MKNKEKYEKPIIVKIVLLGKNDVGKTTLIHKYITGEFIKEHENTKEINYSYNTTIDDKNCDLNILDTPGGDTSQITKETWIKFGNCFLLVYSIDDEESLDYIKNIYEEICNLKENEKFSILIVGNKIDLQENGRKVPKKDIESYTVNECLNFIEISAFDKDGVNEVFTNVIHDYFVIINMKQTKYGCCHCI